MTIFPPPPLRLVLHLSAQGPWVHWWAVDRWQRALLPGSTASPPEELVAAAQRVVRAALATGGARGRRPTIEQQLARATWRLVLPGGSYATVARPAGRWSATVATAVGGELEPHCLLALDHLVVAAWPLGPRQAWVVGMPHALVRAWQAAAQACGLHWEGIWTPATAWVETLLERKDAAPSGPEFEPAPEGTPWQWSDGQVTVVVGLPSAPLKRPGETTAAVPAGWGIQVRAAGGTVGSTLPLARWLPPGAGAGTDDLPVALWPGVLAGTLSRIDPSESLNLARGAGTAPAVLARRQGPLARALLVASVGVGLLGLAGHRVAMRAQERSTQARQQFRDVWQASQAPAPWPAMPVQALQQQVAAWRALEHRVALGPPVPGTLARLVAVWQVLPPELPLAVSQVRTRGAECWLEGQVPSLAEARRLEEALGRVPQAQVEPLKTSGGDSGLVRVSVHVRWRESSPLEGP